MLNFFQILSHLGALFLHSCNIFLVCCYGDHIRAEGYPFATAMFLATSISMGMHS